jgi:hypothetical protein
MLTDKILVGYCVADLTADNECLRVVTAANDSMDGLTTGNPSASLNAILVLALSLTVLLTNIYNILCSG